MFQVKGIKKEDLKVVAEELGETVLPNFKIADLKEIILQNKNYKDDPGFVKEFLITTIKDRLDREEKEEKERERALEKEEKEREREEKERERALEREEKERERALEKEEKERERALELEKTKLEYQNQLELAKIQSELSHNRSYNDNSTTDTMNSIEHDTSLENIIRSVRTLTIPIPSRPEGWTLFFGSLERAFETKNVPQEFKAEILINLLGEKATNLLIYINDEEIKNYESVKTIVLREYEPSAQTCLENFRRARRNSNETHMQFCSRLYSTWEYYCKLRKATDIETVNQLIVSDRLFQTLDYETKSHIGIRQRENWFKPIELAKECDVFFASKGKSYSIENQLGSERFRNYNNHGNFNNHPKYIPPTFRRNDHRISNNAENRSKQCYVCMETDHIARSCPQKFKSRENQNRDDGRYPETAKVDDLLVAKIVSNNSIIITEAKFKTKLDIPPLQYININVNGHDVEAILDSGTQIPVLHPKDVPDSQENCGTIMLSSAFGEKTKAILTKVFMSIKNEEKGNVLAPVEVMIAVTDKLIGPSLLPTHVAESLQKETEIFPNLRKNVHNIETEEIQNLNGTEPQKLEEVQEECKTSKNNLHELKQEKCNYPETEDTEDPATRLTFVKRTHYGMNYRESDGEQEKKRKASPTKSTEISSKGGRRTSAAPEPESDEKIKPLRQSSRSATSMDDSPSKKPSRNVKVKRHTEEDDHLEEFRNSRVADEEDKIKHKSVGNLAQNSTYSLNEHLKDYEANENESANKYIEEKDAETDYIKDTEVKDEKNTGKKVKEYTERVRGEVMEINKRTLKQKMENPKYSKKRRKKRRNL